MQIVEVCHIKLLARLDVSLRGNDHGGRFGDMSSTGVWLATVVQERVDWIDCACYVFSTTVLVVRRPSPDGLENPGVVSLIREDVNAKCGENPLRHVDVGS